MTVIAARDPRVAATTHHHRSRPRGPLTVVDRPRPAVSGRRLGHLQPAAGGRLQHPGGRSSGRPPCRRHRLPEAAPQKEACSQVIPGAVDADIDRVTTELVEAGGQLCDPSLRIHHPPGKLSQLIAEDVSNLPKVAPVADRTRLPDQPADILGRPHELGMPVANVDPGNGAPTKT